MGSVGPGGALQGGHFVAGRFGHGLELNMQEQFGLTFPLEIVPTQAGCIEFWAKFQDLPPNVPVGQKSELIGITDSDGCNQGYFLSLNSNDGAANGGLCVRFGSIGSAGTGQFGFWTYGRSLKTDDLGGWHHFAVVWNPAGIPGVADGTHGLAAFVDGQLNTGAWNSSVIPAGPLVLPQGGRLGFFPSRLGFSSSRITLDNLKIWSYAKTDFSDRNAE